jgi:hypothetical protein
MDPDVRAHRGSARPLVVVDAANVVGAVPDGWWRRRSEATELLRDALGPLAGTGLHASGLPDRLTPLTVPPLEVVLVVEGAASGVASSPTVRVVAARDGGDDAIVDLVVADGPGRLCVVVTGDRALRRRVTRLGASVLGPRALPPRSRLDAP